jgi:hypothetical protein
MRTSLYVIVGVVAVLGAVLLLSSGPGNTAGFASSTPKNSCSDTDGGQNVLVRGTVSGISNGKAFSFSDDCSSASNVYEGYCQGSSSKAAILTCGAGTICQNGACVRAPYCGDATCNNGETCNTCPTDCGACPIPDSCADSDGGIVITSYGTTTGTSNGAPYTYADNCLNSLVLAEQYCVGTMPAQTWIQCNSTNTTTTCSQGQCI